MAILAYGTGIMLYVYLADLIVTIHLAFVGFVLVGQVAILIGS